jgi:hypothetical protein
MTAAVLSADYMLSPVEMEAYSLQGMKKMVSVIGNLRKMNPKLRFLGMVPNKVDARKPRHVANLAMLQQAYPQLVLPFSIGARDSIAEALGEQMPVWKIKKTAARKATQEVRALARICIHENGDCSMSAVKTPRRRPARPQTSRKALAGPGWLGRPVEPPGRASGRQRGSAGPLELPLHLIDEDAPAAHGRQPRLLAGEHRGDRP